MKILMAIFSGTGNTRMVAEELADCLGKSKTDVDLLNIEDLMGQDIDLSGYDLIGLGFPVYDLLPPQIVFDFLRQLEPVAPSVPLFLFCTQALVRGDCLSHAAKAALKKNLPTIARTGFFCPSNGLILYEDPNHPRCRTIRFEPGIADKITRFAKDVLDKAEKYALRSFRRRFVTFPVFHLVRWFSQRLYGDRYYRDLSISDNCNGCLLCVRSCPSGNFLAEGSEVRILHENGCLRCLRCVNLCPKRAVSFTSRPFRGNYSEEQRKTLFAAASSVPTAETSESDEAS